MPGEQRIPVARRVGQLRQVWTLTGRAFFPDPLTHELAGRLRKAAEHARLSTNSTHRGCCWTPELLPWSAKAEPLLRDQYARRGRGSAGRPACCVDILAVAAASGLDVTDLLDRTRYRVANAAAYTQA